MPTPHLSSYVERLPATGTFSVWAGPLDGPAAFAFRADEPHYAASTMKLPLVIAAYRRAEAGRLDLDATVEVRAEFESVVGGLRFGMDREEDSDEETWRRLGQAVSLRWLANRSIVRSGNLSTNLLLDAVGLPAVQEVLDLAGTTGTVVGRGIEDYPARDAGVHNLVTAADLAAILQALAAGRLTCPAVREEVLATLLAQQINDAIPPGLPAGTRVAHKSGWVPGVSHDAGIVYPADSAPYVLVVCTTSELTEQEGLQTISAAAAASWADRAELA